MKLALQAITLFIFMCCISTNSAIAQQNVALENLSPVPIKKSVRLKQGSERAVIALKIENPTRFMRDAKKRIVNEEQYSFSMTFVNVNLEKGKFKSSGGVFHLTNVDQGYVFMLVKAKPLALKTIGGDRLENIKSRKGAPRLCFHDDTFYFDVVAGSVNFLGTVDQNDIIENLSYAMDNVEAPSKWVTSAIVGEYIRRPKIIAPSATDIERLVEYYPITSPKLKAQLYLSV